jgi:hypothetical protein
MNYYIFLNLKNGTNKAKCQRNLEEESVNPLLGSDGEVQNAGVVAAEDHDATIVGGKNVIIRPYVDMVVADAKSENGDDGSHSPRDLLNLNQHAEDDDEDVEAEENTATQTTTHVRHGHGPNRMPSERYVITEVSDVGEPTKPTTSVNVWTIALGKVVREKVVITYIIWKRKIPDKYVV